MKLNRSRLTNDQTQKLLEHFVAGTSARMVADITGVNKNTAILFYHKIRLLIALKLKQEKESLAFASQNIILNYNLLSHLLEQEASRRKGEKLPVFVVVKREKKIYAFCPSKNNEAECSNERNALWPHAIFYIDHDVKILNVNNICFHRTTSNGEKVLKKGQRSVIDSIENFWKLTKIHWLKFNGIPLENFSLFLSEAEWRYNYKNSENLLKTLLHWIKN